MGGQIHTANKYCSLTFLPNDQWRPEAISVMWVKKITIHSFEYDVKKSLCRNTNTYFPIRHKGRTQLKKTLHMSYSSTITQHFKEYPCPHSRTKVILNEKTIILNRKNKNTK